MAETTSSSSLRTVLRSGTSDDHRRLDKAVGEWSVTSSVEGYVNYLARMRLLHLGYQQSIARISAKIGLPDNSQQLAQAIRHDMLATVADGEQPCTEIAIQTPCGAEEAAAWGHAYVLEGSCLGAKHLLAAVRSGLPSDTSAEYLEAMSRNGHRRWSRLADALGKMPNRDGQALEAARQVFREAIRLFQTKN